MTAFVYMLRCRDGRYYVGSTRASLERRIGEHNAGSFGGFTKSRRPVELVYSQEFDRVTDAIAAERQLKGWSRAKKEALDALVVQIRTTEARLAAGRPPGDGPSMADLVSFHSFVERVREWPIGGSTVLRGTLVAALAPGSWLGGALVERLLEAALR